MIGYTAAQRRKILERDSNENGEVQCLATLAGISHYCDIKEHSPECDHQTPKRFALRWLKWGERKTDSPENLGMECRNFHQNIRHPDMKEARSGYAQGKKGEAFKKVFERRDKLTDKGIRYDYTVYEDELAEQIRINNEKMDKKYGGRRKWWPW